MAPCKKSCGSFGSAGHRCAQCYQHHHLSAGVGGVAPCVNSCGSFGSATTNHLCARCYRDRLNAVDRAAEAARMQALLVRLGGEAAAAADIAVPKTAGTNRCAVCRKKVGLLGFTCRCGGAFCSVHRYAEAHTCGFDYKKTGRKRIAAQNPGVVAFKIARI